MNTLLEIKNITKYYGSVLLEGREVAGMREQDLAAFRRDRLGFIFQEYNLLDTLMVGENIVLPLNLQRAVLIAIVIAGVYAMYFLITYYISSGHVICYGTEGGSRDGHSL